jgi:hypothetical protein
MRDLRAGWGARAKRNRAGLGCHANNRRLQLALALGVADAVEPDDDEPEEEDEPLDDEPEEEDEPLDAPPLDAAFPSPDDLPSLELLLSELSDLEAGAAALALLSSEPLFELAPGLL